MAGTYKNLILSHASLVRYLRMGETSGSTLTDSSPSAVNVTKAAGNLLPVRGVIKSDPNGALNFDGTTYYSSATAPSAATWSVEAWVKPSSTPVAAGQIAPIVTTLYAGGKINYVMGFDSGILTTGFFAGMWLPGWFVTSGYPLPTNVWSHTVATCDSSNIRLYVNGTLVRTQPYTGTPGGADGLILGKRWDSSEFLNAQVDEVAIYNAVLTPTEILYHYNTGLAESVMFKANKVVFNRFGMISFCGTGCDCNHHLGDPSPCTWPMDVSQPACVVIRKQDFTACPDCVTTITTGTLPAELWYDGAVLFATNDTDDTWRNSTNIRLYANIQLDTGTCKWVLTVRCKEGPSYYDVWVGEKVTGKTPVGTYIRTSGCDTTEQITVN